MLTISISTLLPKGWLFDLKKKERKKTHTVTSRSLVRYPNRYPQKPWLGFWYLPAPALSKSRATGSRKPEVWRS